MKPQLKGVSDHISISPSTTGTRTTIDMRQNASVVRREHSEIYQPDKNNEAVAHHDSEDER